MNSVSNTTENLPVNIDLLKRGYVLLCEVNENRGFESSAALFFWGGGGAKIGTIHSMVAPLRRSMHFLDYCPMWKL